MVWKILLFNTLEICCLLAPRSHSGWSHLVLSPPSWPCVYLVVVFIVRAHGTIGTIARVGCSPAQPRSHFVECLITALKTCAERLLTITSFQRLEYVHRSCIYTPGVYEQRSERNVKAMASYVQFWCRLSRTTSTKSQELRFTASPDIGHGVYCHSSVSCCSCDLEHNTYLSIRWLVFRYTW